MLMTYLYLTLLSFWFWVCFYFCFCRFGSCYGPFVSTSLLLLLLISGSGIKGVTKGIQKGT